MAPLTVVLPENTASITGSLLLGHMINWWLFGALTIQVYWYFLAFPDDHPALKGFVYAVYATETSQSIIVVRDAFAMFASGFGKVDAVTSVQTEWFSVPLLNGIIACAVQIYYARRLYLFSKSRFLAISIGSLALLQCGAGITSGVQSYHATYSNLAEKVFVSTTIWLVTSVICDVMITVCMTSLLLSKDNGMPATHALVMKLVQLIIESGLLTATVAIVDLVLLLSFQHHPYHACASLALGKLYGNSLMVLLNNRTQLRAIRDSMQVRNFLNEELHAT